MSAADPFAGIVAAVIGEVDKELRKRIAAKKRPIGRPPKPKTGTVGKPPAKVIKPKPKSINPQGNHEPKAPRILAVPGQRIGMLVVIGEGKRNPNATSKGSYARRWLCQCDCGNVRDVSMANIRAGRVKSCGCMIGQMTRFNDWGVK